MKVAAWFSFMIALIVVAVVSGVTGNRLGLAAGLVAVISSSFMFMLHFVEALRDMRH